MALTFEVSPTDVANEALGQLGKDFIIDIEDAANPVAIKTKRYFLSVLRAMLRDHPYKFADHKTELATTGISPVADFTHAYALPPDCVRVTEVNGSTDMSRWVVQGRQLMTTDSVVIIKYTRWETDPNIWDGAFYQAFVTYLSTRLAPAFDSDMAKASDLYKLYQLQSFDAKAISGQEGSQEVMRCDDIVDLIRE